MAKFCRYCGHPIREGANFCPACGKSQAKTPQVQTSSALATAGELDFGEITIPGMTGMSEPVAEVFSLVGGMIRGIGSYLSGIIQIFKKPASLIGVLLFAAVWFVLARFRGSDSEIVRILSRLTFSEGGFDRSAPGMICGILGKGTVAAAMISLFTGGLKKLFGGIGIFFTGRGNRRSILSILFGILFGVLVYFGFTGINASKDTVMAGIAGAVLSLEALGSGSGKLYGLVQSLTSRKVNGTRTSVEGGCDGMLTGLILGFILAAVMSSLEIMEGLL